jgi:hypothetical protein
MTPTSVRLRLSAFQDAFATALEASADAAVTAAMPAACPDIAKLVAQPGFAVYRNTVLKGCIDALQANYPAVCRLTCEEWFRAAAALFARRHPPRAPMLVDYGDRFADFLAGFEPARGLPYLAAVARLDRFWTEAHLAPDAASVAAADLARLAPAVLGRSVLRPHPSARWAWCDEIPAATIWQRNRDAVQDSAVSDEHGQIAWRGEGILVVRPQAVVRWIPLRQAGCAFLDACAAGATLAAAAEAALAVEAQTDLSALFAQTLEAGAFGRLAVSDDPSKDLP